MDSTSDGAGVGPWASAGVRTWSPVGGLDGVAPRKRMARLGGLGRRLREA